MTQAGGQVPTPDAALLRAVGTWGLAASIVNVTVGAGIFRLPASVASSLGPAAPLAYGLCAVAMGLIVLCFAEAGSRVSLTGGLYAYVEVAFGPFVGFLGGALLWAGLTAALAAVVTFFAESLGALVPALASTSARQTTIVVVLAVLAALNVLGVRDANRFNAVMTVAKLVPLALLVAAGAFAMQRENLAWHELPSAGAVARASTILLFAFLGVERSVCGRAWRAKTRTRSVAATRANKNSRSRWNTGTPSAMRSNGSPRESSCTAKPSRSACAWPLS